MARLQALTQQHSLERSFGPTSEGMVGGISGSSEGVPKMHPLGSSNPVFKAGNLVHMLRVKSFKLPRVGGRTGLPGFKSKLPGLHLPKI